jgi:hypothetical protein
MRDSYSDHDVLRCIALTNDIGSVMADFDRTGCILTEEDQRVYLKNSQYESRVQQAYDALDALGSSFGYSTWYLVVKNAWRELGSRSDFCFKNLERNRGGANASGRVWATIAFHDAQRAIDLFLSAVAQYPWYFFDDDFLQSTALLDLSVQERLDTWMQMAQPSHEATLAMDFLV